MTKGDPVAAITTRLGDGSKLEMTPAEIRADVEDGVAAAEKRARVAPLAADEIDHLVDIFSSSARFSAVDVGDEVILSSDGTCSLDTGLLGEQLLVYQNSLGADILELATWDYSYKAIKTIVTSEAQTMKAAQLATVAPLQYGAMPDLGRYSQPDGPVANWSELMPQGRIDDARAAQEQAVDLAVDDMVFCADHLWAAGADGMNYDTAGASGDADLLATLRTVETLHEKYPDIGLEVGMASEMVLGMHGELEYKGHRLAGMWPREQQRVVTEAGATIFGPTVTTNTTRSVAWNVARACALIKPCMDEATIPVHPNVGMGVCGVPMSAFPPHDAVSRVSRAMVDILKIDGL
jgi:dimethylamine---corrinoid protein Co-methyltransferase